MDDKYYLVLYNGYPMHLCAFKDTAEVYLKKLKENKSLIGHFEIKEMQVSY